MTGKEKCKLLKQIRKEFAESNGISYPTEECTFEGECNGTCPQCDAEIRYLDDQMQQKAARGEKITFAGLSLDTYEGVEGGNSSTEDPAGERLRLFVKNLESLTPTEKIVLGHYHAGLTTAQTLEAMFISENTLKFHNKNLYKKLLVSSRKELLGLYSEAKKLTPNL